MKKFICVTTMLVCVLTFENSYGQELDTIPPKFEIYLDALRSDFPYDEYYDSEENLLAINADWCDKFPEDFINIMDYYFTITDNSDSIIVTYKDSLNWNSETLIRYYEAMDTSGNKSNLEVRVTKSSSPGPISYLDVVFDPPNNTTLQFGPFDDEEKIVYLNCGTSEVKIDVMVGFVCSSKDARYEWRIDNKPVFNDGHSGIAFNLDTMNNETNVSIYVYESGSISGQFKIIKIADESFKTIEQPSCNQSYDGSIQLDGVTEVLWAHNDSTSESLKNLGPGVYPVSYRSNDCEFKDTITLVPENVLDFTISNDTIDLGQNEMLTIKNNSDMNGDYSWQIGDSTFVNNTSEFNYSFKSPGNYEIKLISNQGSCQDTIFKSIEAVGRITTTYADPLSSINIGPNPFTNVLNIELKKVWDYNITIYGIDGKIYFKDQFYAIRNKELDLGFLNPGVYFVNIISPKNSEHVKGFKIVKLWE